jgi:hypothetical protein
MNATNPDETVWSRFSAEEILAHIRRLYSRLRELPSEPGGTRHSAAYKSLEVEIRLWAGRYSTVSRTAAESGLASGQLPAAHSPE